jgi:hypothetical protein
MPRCWRGRARWARLSKGGLPFHTRDFRGCFGRLSSSAVSHGYRRLGLAGRPTRTFVFLVWRPAQRCRSKSWPTSFDHAGTGHPGTVAPSGEYRCYLVHLLSGIRVKARCQEAPASSAAGRDHLMRQRAGSTSRVRCGRVLRHGSLGGGCGKRNTFRHPGEPGGGNVAALFENRARLKPTASNVRAEEDSDKPER